MKIRILLGLFIGLMMMVGSFSYADTMVPIFTASGLELNLWYRPNEKVYRYTVKNLKGDVTSGQMRNLEFEVIVPLNGKNVTIKIKNASGGTLFLFNAPMRYGLHDDQAAAVPNPQIPGQYILDCLKSLREGKAKRLRYKAEKSTYDKVLVPRSLICTY